MKAIKQYINENFNSDWDYVIEMASIGYPVLNKTNHYIALHGKNAGDIERPHIHIYLENDKRPFNKFNFEIALDEILCYDEINLIRMKDISKKLIIPIDKNVHGMAIQNYIMILKIGYFHQMLKYVVII